MQEVGLFIRACDIAFIEGVSYTTAWVRLRSLKDALAKKERQRITIKEYADFFGVTEKEVREKLQPKK